MTDRSRLDDELGALVQTTVERWGVVVEHAGLRSIAPTRETLRITHPGVVAKIGGEHLHIKFDDRDQETVQMRNIRRDKPK